MPKRKGSGAFIVPLCFKKACGIRSFHQLLYVIGIIFTLIISFYYLISSEAFIDIDPNKDVVMINNSDISTYFIPKFSDPNFHYPNIHSNLTNTCINRSDYMNDLARLFGFQTSFSFKRDTYVLVFGASSAVGKYVIKELVKRKIKYIPFNSADTFGPSSILYNFFPLLNIQGAIVADTTSFSPDSIQYAKDACGFLTSYRKRMIVLVMPPIDSISIDSLRWYNSKLVYVPNIFDSSTFDLTNPLFRAQFNCKYKNRTDYYKEDLFHIIYPEEVAKVLIEQFFAVEPRDVSIVGNSNIKLENALKYAVRPYPDCDLNDIYSDIASPVTSLSQIVVGKPNVNIEKLITKQFGKPLQYNAKKNYISFIIAVNISNSGDKATFTQFLTEMANAYKDHQHVGADFILVDISEKENEIREDIELEFQYRYFLEYVKLIRHPSSATKTIYSAWNIGIRRAKGEFIALMTFKDFVSRDFFGFIDAQKFDKRIIYRSRTYMTNSNRTIRHAFSGNDISDAQNVRDFCTSKYDGLVPILNVASNHNQAVACNQISFLMASREVWDKIGGLPEFPVTGGFEMGYIIMSRFLRMFPTYSTVNMREPLIKLVDEEPFDTIPGIDLAKISDELWCTGRSSFIEQFENENWGFKGQDIPIQEYTIRKRVY
ncbi:hypothetical protein TVAG_311690 [Trichomonas vaginalis G3]|uniref:Uncharacterized protein n=1 Tax=Trichomonas vaginalis (strain ATCC PRA-98 / G3) TaxID=412133 RepID=A2EJX6_TRIV3|nr:nucleotide-diphospho-sugar transferases family [Trichomonas vaginalis G3]EAY07044.1 hypothetical protein TVAG_311690 [Trichomonas vaginalis G3]KAI5529560.1 nucleotide-diphospho-sugar transferases family [Trichomonas vaginalis G3]|eukprot:XP_001319267.1 hypothetical protein [Trichomonas vaginalis G3]